VAVAYHYGLWRYGFNLMIDWKLAVDLWNRGYDTFDISSYMSNSLGFKVRESVIYNQLPKYRAIYK
jgi:hypothetical protein